jgi:hypothetical protein
MEQSGTGLKYQLIYKSIIKKEIPALFVAVLCTKQAELRPKKD